MARLTPECLRQGGWLPAGEWDTHETRSLSQCDAVTMVMLPIVMALATWPLGTPTPAPDPGAHGLPRGRFLVDASEAANAPHH
eukprot:2217177-Prymnesium_polylepis.1